MGDWIGVFCLFALAAFIVFDSSRKVRLPTENEKNKGVTPGSAALEIGLLILAMAFAASGVIQIMSPTEPVISGRYALLFLSIYEIAGPQSVSVLLFLASCIIFWILIARKKCSRH